RFELAQPPDTYRNDHSKMVVQLAQPCRVNMRLWTPAVGIRPNPSTDVADSGRRGGLRIVVDRDLCQGHGVCESEAPDVFQVAKDRSLTILDERPDESRRAAVEQAVKYCPTHALTIEED